MISSANLQETLGISWYEGALLDVIHGSKKQIKL